MGDSWTLDSRCGRLVAQQGRISLEGATSDGAVGPVHGQYDGRTHECDRTATLITVDTWLSHSDGTVATALTDGELVVLDRDYEYFTLNDSGARVWELLNEPHQLGELVAVLTEEYEISRQVCLEGLLPLLDTFLDRGCITVSAPADSIDAPSAG